MSQRRQAIRQLNTSDVTYLSKRSLMSTAYMKNPDAKCTIHRIGDLLDNRLILACYGHRAAYMVMRALYLRDVEHSSWNSLLVEFNRMSVGIFNP